MGKLVDVGDGGVGVETLTPLKQGSIVRVAAELHNTDFGLKVRGRARVAHSVGLPDGAYQDGLQFVEVAYARAS